jgi:N-acetyl sugar amidotransferase
MAPPNQNLQTCTRGIWNTTIPGISFDEEGVSNYAKMFDSLCNAYPRGEKGKKDWLDLVAKIKKKGINNPYDCIVGVSGGTDSSYLLYVAKQFGLRPLAVNLDNGWTSEIAVRNIKNITQKLNIPLITYVINYEEVKHVLRSYIKASLPWIDGPTDLAIKAVLYKIARQEKIKFILNGSDFRSEGKQPTEWTYSDAKQLKFLVKKFENKKLKTFPYYTLTSLFRFGFILGIKMHRPYYYIDYQKKMAQDFLINNFSWEYYGGHHHENRFTKFAIAYWLPQKFGIDKRIITLSAQVLSGEISRDSALEQIREEIFSIDQLRIEKEYILKKLDFDENEFNQLMAAPNKFYFDYPSYMPLLKKYKSIFKNIILKILPFQPSLFFENDARNI